MSHVTSELAWKLSRSKGLGSVTGYLTNNGSVSPGCLPLSLFKKYIPEKRPLTQTGPRKVCHCHLSAVNGNLADRWWFRKGSPERTYWSHLACKGHILGGFSCQSKTCTK